MTLMSSPSTSSRTELTIIPGEGRPWADRFPTLDLFDPLGDGAGTVKVTMPGPALTVGGTPQDAAAFLADLARACLMAGALHLETAPSDPYDLPGEDDTSDGETGRDRQITLLRLLAALVTVTVSGVKPDDLDLMFTVSRHLTGKAPAA